MFKFTGKRPQNLGVKDGRLAACANKPNAVSSQADASDAVHYIAPLQVPGGMAAVRALLEKSERVHIVEAKPGYLYAEFSTKLMGYVDDVEFYDDGKAIQVRSASRLGYSDLGVNRKRVEAIRSALR